LRCISKFETPCFDMAVQFGIEPNAAVDGRLFLVRVLAGGTVHNWLCGKRFAQ